MSWQHSARLAANGHPQHRPGRHSRAGGDENRLSSKDLEAIQKRALEEGLPYQALISSLLHKYASGRLKEVSRQGSEPSAD
jgi:hypothetical protein